MQTASESRDSGAGHAREPRQQREDDIETREPWALLQSIADGQLTAEEALARLAPGSAEDLGFANLDHDRTRRKGFPEVVFAAGKTLPQIAAAAERIYEASGVVLVTRTDAPGFEAIRARIPDARFNKLGQLVWADRRPPADRVPGVVIATAGTSDQWVSEEAAETAQLLGCEVERLNDIGVAGLHRLLAARPTLEDARVIVAIAGMEGALPSVIAGLVAAPVIAVPTSVGYGANFEGIAPLLGMLNSCAPGVAVVNIDNGFGAGYLAAIIARAGHRQPA